MCVCVLVYYVVGKPLCLNRPSERGARGACSGVQRKLSTLSACTNEDICVLSFTIDSLAPVSYTHLTLPTKRLV